MSNILLNHDNFRQSGLNPPPVALARSGASVFMFRVGKERAAEAEAIGGSEEVAMGGRRMRGLYFVSADDCPEMRFKAWRSLALANVLSLPPK